MTPEERILIAVAPELQQLLEEELARRIAELRARHPQREEICVHCKQPARLIAEGTHTECLDAPDGSGIHRWAEHKEE